MRSGPGALSAWDSSRRSICKAFPALRHQLNGLMVLHEAALRRLVVILIVFNYKNMGEPVHGAFQELLESPKALCEPFMPAE